jgi:glycolate oxidase FAD binding subunit
MKSFIDTLPENITDYSDVRRDGNGSYEIYDLFPDVTASPNSEEEVGSFLRHAQEHGAAVCTWGGGTSIAMGNPPDAYVAALDMKKLDGIKEYEPADLTVIAGAGMTLEKLNSVLYEQRQFVPLNPPHPEKATVGGVLSSNAYGFLRESYGTARDMTLGLRFARADGSLIKGGGKVAKNVAGYDLTRFMIGSWGTLGIITEAAFRVRPIPESSMTLIAGFNSITNAYEAAFDILDSFYAPTFMIGLNHALAGKIPAGNVSTVSNRFTFIIGADDIDAIVIRQESELKGACKTRGASDVLTFEDKTSTEIREFLRDYASNANDGIVCKIITSRTGAFDVIEHIEKIGKDNAVVFETMTYIGSGITYVFLPGDSLQSDREMCLRSLKNLQEYVKVEKGYFTVGNAPLWIKEHFPVWDYIPGSDIMKKLKKQFDPNNILNPGRYIRAGD